jgi:putative peptidoglycan lipid II flippase
MRLALTLGILSATSLFLAFLQQWYVLVVIGPGVQTDALFAGLAIPQLILSLVSGSLVFVIVPLLSGENVESAARDVWTLLSAVAAFFTGIALILIVSASIWAPRLFPGFSTNESRLLISLVRIQLLGMIGTALMGVLVAWCHSQKRFIRAELSQFIASAATFGFLVWALPRFGIAAAAWLSAARAALAVALLFPTLGWVGRISFSGSVLREGWRRARPLLLGTTYYKTDPVVDRFLASMSPAGQLSLLHLAQQIFGAATQIVNSGLAAPSIPVLSEEAKRDRWDAFRLILWRRIFVILVVTVLGYAALIVIGQPFLAMLIGHGGVTRENVHFLWLVLLGLGGVLVFGSIGNVTAGGFYAKGDTRTPTVIGVVTYTVYIPLKIVAYLRYGVVALAVATSVFTTVNVVIQFALLQFGRAGRMRVVHAHEVV